MFELILYLSLFSYFFLSSFLPTLSLLSGLLHACYMETWIETSTGNRIARLAEIKGANLISIADNCTIGENCTLNGSVLTTAPKDPSIVLGKYCHLALGVSVDPPLLKIVDAKKVHANVSIGNYTSVGERTRVKLVLVGNRVWIGCDCDLGEMTTINDCCVVENNTVIPKKAVIPPYSRVSGVPGKNYCVEELGGGYRKVLETDARMRHILG